MPDTIEQQLLEARHALTQVHGPIEAALVRKMLIQEAVLDYPDTVFDFGEELPLDIGIFRVRPITIEADWSSKSGQLVLHTGQRVLDFHVRSGLPPGSINNQSANEGYAEIARDYVPTTNVEYIVGGTYETMAKSAEKNQGFDIEELDDLPPEIKRFASLYWQCKTGLKEKHFGKIFVVSMPIERFLERFSAI